MRMFQKAVRSQAKIRLGLCGVAGSGKTWSALAVASGLGNRIALIDTEHGSGSLYAEQFDYDVCTLKPPFSVEKYLCAIADAEQSGYEVIIIDSLSHAWAGAGGLLEVHGDLTAASKSKNSWAAWRDVTPLHNKLVEAILQSPCHIIATMRSKTEYVQTDEKKIERVGMAPVQREGMDYEFTIVFDLSISHKASVSKDRTGLFDGRVLTPSKDTGIGILQWLKGAKPEPPEAPQPGDNAKLIAMLNAFKELGVDDVNVLDGIPVTICRVIYKTLKERLALNPDESPNEALVEVTKEIRQ